MACKNVKGCQEKSPFQEDKEALVLGEGCVPQFLFKDTEDMQVDGNMEDSKENEFAGAKFKIDNDFLSLLQSELPSLKFASLPITQNSYRTK